VDQANLAILEVAVVLQQLIEHRRCGEALAQQPQRQPVVALVGEGLADGDTGHRLHAAAVAADRDREGRDADPHAPRARATAENGVGHLYLLFPSPFTRGRLPAGPEGKAPVAAVRISTS